MKFVDVEWDKASCASVGGNFWLAEPGDMESTALAIRTCKQCPIMEQCGQYAIENETEWGIWGSLGTKKRKRLRSQLRAG